MEILDNQNQHRIRNDAGLDSHQRVAVFSRLVVELGEIWSVGNREGWLIREGPSGESCVPVWPLQSGTKPFLAESVCQFSASPVPLARFLDELLPLMEDLGLELEVFPVAEESGVIMSPDAITELLERELASNST